MVMQRKFYSLLFALLFLAPTFLSAQNILYIARNNPPDGNDPSVITVLEDLGYAVTAIGASEYTVTSHLDYAPDLIFFGEYLSSSGVTPFADSGFPLPCVSLEGYCTRSNRWALLASDDDFGQIREDAQFGITPVIPDHYSVEVIADHPIFSEAGISSGDEFAWSTEGTAPPEVVWYTSMPQASATALADITDASNADLHTFWTIEPDAADPTNPLQHRLVIWGVHDNGLAATTDQFKSVIDNSIKWALDMLDTGGDEASLLYIARNNPPDGNDPAVITGLENLGYSVTAIGASEFTVTSHLDYAPDVLFFGEYLSSSGVTPFADAGFPLPCVSLEGYCPRSNRWALLASDDDFGQIREDAQFGITPVIPDHYSVDVIEDHPIFSTAGISSGDSFAWSTEGTAPPEVVWFTQMPQAAATPLANITDATNADLHTFWAIEPDAADATNPLQHRLVIWGVHDNGFAATTEDFWNVIDNSIQWVLGNLVSSAKETDILNTELTNYPNPFSTSTEITFSLKENANVELRVFDALGRVVSTNRDFFAAGEQRITYTNNGLQRGMYIYSLYADGLFAGSGKMMVK